MKIIKATYGGKDVTNQVNALTRNDRLDITASNSLFGDPAVGTVKHLVVDFEINGRQYTNSVKEGEQISIPESTYDRLGVFYTNNDKEETADTIEFSLNRIKVASEDKADIITSVWHPIYSNPFPQYPSWMKVGGHLNQCLQILHLLYVAAKRKDYKYVSFLEHDVLYPEGYFDYPDFEEGKVLVNTNYLGLCKGGWQSKNPSEDPLFQMTMTMNNAIDHFHLVFQEALLTNSGNLDKPPLTREVWRCDNPAVHVNHGFHFTSHYSTYSIKNFDEVNPYWGHKDNYSYLFPKEESDEQSETLHLLAEKDGQSSADVIEI